MSLPQETSAAEIARRDVLWRVGTALEYISLEEWDTAGRLLAEAALSVFNAGWVALPPEVLKALFRACSELREFERRRAGP